MSKVRVSADWSFGLTANCGHSPITKIKLFLQPQEVLLIATILTNLYTCMSGGNEISAFFALKSPVPIICTQTINKMSIYFGIFQLVMFEGQMFAFVPPTVLRVISFSERWARDYSIQSAHSQVAFTVFPLLEKSARKRNPIRVDF